MSQDGSCPDNTALHAAVLSRSRGVLFHCAAVEAGICASSGSACLADSPDPSHVIAAMKPGDAAGQSVRFSIGSVAAADIARVISSVAGIIPSLRSFSVLTFRYGRRTRDCRDRGGGIGMVMTATFQPPALDLRHPAQDLSAVLSMAQFFSPRPPMNTDSLYASAETLFTQLEQKQIPHVLVGGLALLFHAESRNTEDVDLIVALPDVQALPDLRVEERNEWFAKALFGPVRVDLRFTANPLFALVAAQHVESRTFRSHTLRVATAEGLLLLKLYALPSLYRQGQIARAALYESDLALLLLSHPVADDKLLAALRPHMIETDILALADVLRDVRARIGRKF